MFCVTLARVGAATPGGATLHSCESSNSLERSNSLEKSNWLERSTLHSCDQLGQYSKELFMVSLMIYSSRMTYSSLRVVGGTSAYLGNTPQKLLLSNDFSSLRVVRGIPHTWAILQRTLYGDSTYSSLMSYCFLMSCSSRMTYSSLTSYTSTPENSPWLIGDFTILFERKKSFLKNSPWFNGDLT